MRFILLLLIPLLVHCQSPQPEVRAAQPAVPPKTPTVSVAAPAPSPVFAGEPVAFAPAEVLHERGDFLVERQIWRFQQRQGVTWRVRVPREASVTVQPSDDVVGFEQLLPTDDGPWAAINGGFYEPVPDDSERKGRAMGLVVSNGEEHSKLTRRGGSGVFYVDDDGAHIAHRKGFRIKSSHALQSIDRLADAGKSVVTRRQMPGAARSAVAVSADYLWLIVSAADADIAEREDGVQLSRSEEGLPLWAFAEYVVASTNASEALNLDGGISTQLAVRDADYALNIRGVRGTINAVVVRGQSR